MKPIQVGLWHTSTAGGTALESCWQALGPTIRISKWIGRQDSNVADYVALLEAEQAALNLNASKLHVFSDAQVIVASSSIVAWDDLVAARRANGKLELPNKTTDAALQYLLTGDPEAWKHLIAILMVARGKLFLQEPGMSVDDATQRFLEVWLADKFAPYRDADADTICEAGERGEFRYLGRQAKHALIDEIRRHYASQDALDQHLTDEERWAGLRPRVVSLDAPLDDDADFTLADLVAIDPNLDNSTISQLPSAIGRHPGLEPHTLKRTAQNGDAEFKQLLGPLHDVLVTALGSFEACPEDFRTGDAARAVSAARDVSLQTARIKLRQLAATCRRAFDNHNPTVRDLFAKLITPGRATFSMLDTNVP
jgi:hypothetical protein